MKHINSNEVFNKKGKKTTGITAVLVAGTLVVSGIVATALHKDKTISNKSETTIESTEEYPLNSLLVLTEDFDINDKEVINKRAKAIYNLSEKEYEVIDITNMIYILEEKYDAITYPEGAKSDKEKFEYLQQLALLLGTVLDDGLYEYTDALVNEEIILEQQKSVPCAYMFMAKTTEGKKQAIELAKIYYEQRENVKNKNTDAMSITAGKYYNLYKSIEKMDLSASEIVALYKNFSAINPLFTPYLSLEQAEELDDILGKSAASTNIIFQSAAQGLDISEILEKGEFGKDTTPFGESYKAKDEAVANKHTASGNVSSGKPKVEKPGGEKVNNSNGTKEQINVPTTSKEETTFVVPVTEGKVEVTNPEGDSFVVEITGSGQYVVEEEGNELVSEVAVENTRSIMKEDFVYSDAEAAELADKAHYKDLYSGIRK